MQTPAAFEYERATSVEGAIASLREHGSGARIIAGGHSLLPMMKLRLASPEHLIDINDLAELSYIREEGGEIRIGALTRHKDLLSSELLAEHLPVFRDAENVIADPVVRNRGTIGGPRDVAAGHDACRFGRSVRRRRRSRVDGLSQGPGRQYNRACRPPAGLTPYRSPAMKIVTWNINGIRARFGTFIALAGRKRARHRLPAGDQDRRRAVPARRDRGARLQRRDARPKRLQRRRDPVEAAVRRGDARPAGRSRRRACALHRRRVLDRARGHCASPRSICPTATRSGRRSSPTSCHGWRGWRTGQRSGLRWKSRWCWPATTTSFPSRSMPGIPENWVDDALFQPQTRQAFRRLSNLGFTDAVRVGHRCAADLHVLGLSGRRLAEEQRHPHRSPDAVAGSRRPARLRLDRKARPRLGKAVGPRAGGDGTGAVGAETTASGRSRE